MNTTIFSGKEILALAKTAGSSDRYAISHIQVRSHELVSTNGHFLTVVSTNATLGDFDEPRYILASRLLDLRSSDICRITGDGIEATSKRGNTTLIGFSSDSSDDLCYPDIGQVVPSLPETVDNCCYPGIGGACFAGFGIDVLGALFTLIKAFDVNAIKLNSPADQLSPAVIQARRAESPLDIYGVVMPLRLDGEFLDYRGILDGRSQSASRSAA